MSDNIDVPVTVSGGEGIDRVTASVDRLAESMVGLGNTSPALDRLNESMAAMQGGLTTALGTMTSQIAEMKQAMATGFADISATNQKLIEAMGTRQARAIEETGEKSASAWAAAGLKIKAADARTWEQIQRGSAASVTSAFAQLAEGIPVEAVLARYGELATGIAFSMDNNLATLQRYQGEAAAVTERGVDKQLEVDRAFAAAQVELQRRTAAERQALVEKRDVEEYRARSDASAQLQALIEKRDTDEHRARSAASAQLQGIIEKRDLEEYQSRAGAAARLQALIEKRDTEEYSARTAASAQLQALIEKRDTEEYTSRAEAAAKLQALVEKRDLEEYQSRAAAAAQLQALIEKRDMEEYSMRSAASAQLKELIEKRDIEEYRIRSAAAADLRALIEKRDMEEYQLRAAASAQLQGLMEKRDLEEYQMRSAAAQRILEIEQRRDTEMHAMRTTEAQRMAEIQQRRDMEEYAAAQTAAQRIIDIEQRRDTELHNMRTAATADAATQAERQRALNTNYLTASPASQVRTATQAQVYAGLGGDAGAKYGSEAAGADALAQAQRRLAASAAEAATAQARLGAVSAETGIAQFEMSGALRQAEGAFRGAAHEAGIYGMHHGQLIGLLAGGVVAAALHHIAETGAEVEFQLKSLNALSGDMTPVDLNKFIGITAGSMSGLKEAAEGMHALAQAGMDQERAFAALPDLLRLSQLGEMSVAQAAEMAVESMHAFGLTAGDIGKVGDTLVAVGAQANVSVHTLANDMKSAATTGELFGAKMEEITATVGALAERGLTIQPLSSALNKLYEPSAKTAKAMADMGLSARTASGDFKEYTVFMHELAEKVNEYKEPGDPLKALGMSAQSIKAMEVMTQHIETYDHLLHVAKDSAGMMFDATLSKSDTVEGAWKQLGSTFEGSMTKAFEGARPVIQAVEQSLASIAGSKDTQEFLTGLAMGVANLVRDLIEARGAIELFVGGYLAMRGVTAILQLAARETAAVTVATVAQAEASVVAAGAIELEGAAAATASVQLDLFAVSEGAAAAGAVTTAAATVTTAERMAVYATTAGVLTTALGLAGVAAAAYMLTVELMGPKQNEADKQFQQAINTSNTAVDMYDKEIERLERLEAQLIRTGKAGVEAAHDVATATLEMEKSDLEEQIDSLKKHPPKLVANTMPGSPYGVTRLEDSGELDEAQSRLAQITARINEMDRKAIKREALQDRTSSEGNIAGLHDKINSFDSVIFPKVDSKGAREAADAANTLLQELRSTVIVEDNYAATKEKELELEKLITATKKDNPGPAVKEDKSAYKADTEALEEQLRLKKQLLSSDLKDLSSENKRGELGDLQLINQQLALKLAYDKSAADIARQEMDIARAGGAKPRELAKYQSKIDTANGQANSDDRDAARARGDLFDKMEQAQVQAHAQTLAKQGRLDEAFNLEWEAKYGKTLANIDADIEALDTARAAATSDNMRASLDAQKEVYVASKKMYEDLRKEGESNAIFKMDVNQFDKDVEHMVTKLAELRGRVGPGTGLSTQVGNVFAQKRLIEDALPQQQADYEKAKADAGDDPEKLKRVDGMLRRIQSETAELNNIFVGLGQTIAQSLTDAFGKGGAALGGMVTTAAAYDAELKTIQTTLKQSNGTEADKAAAADATASAQIKAYSSMAGAAKGFFDQNSNGYKILSKTEQAYRALELAMTIEAFAKKVFFKTAEVGVTTAAAATNTATEGAATAASVAHAGAQAVAWGITAVAKALASLTFPLNLAAGAATMAAVVALGIGMTGGFGSSVPTAEERQAQQGTGTVLGAKDAKSESISKSIELSAANSSTQINYLAGMLASLQAIQNGITKFAGELVRTADVTGQKVDLGNNAASWSKVFDPIANSIPVLGNITAKLATSIFGGKKTLADSGFSLDASTLGQIASRGVNAQTYADVTTSGGWFKKDKTTTSRADVSDDAERQFSQVLLSLGESVKEAGKLLGASGDDFAAKLNGFVVDIGQVSLKGLSPDEVQKQLESVFSKVGDQMAQAAIPDLQQFQQVGEGYLQTLVRVAADYANVDASLQSVGMAFGAVGLASIPAREDLVALAGGIEKFQSSTAGFATNFLTKQQQQAPVLSYVNQQMTAMNLGWVKTREQFAGVVLGLNLTDPAARKTYASLMTLQDAFAATHAAILDTSKTVQEVADEHKDLQDQYDSLSMTSAQLLAKQRDALDESNRALFDQVQALKDQADAVKKVKDSGAASLGDVDTAYSTLSNIIGRQKTLRQAQIDAETKVVSVLTDIVSSTQSALDSLSELSPEDAAAQRRKAQMTLDNSLALVKGGSTLTDSQNKDLKAALTQLTKDSKNEFTTSQAYLAAQYQTKNKITDLQDSAQDQLTTEQKMLDNDKAQLKAWDQMLTDAKDQIDQLKGIGATAMSIEQALANLAQKIGAAQANPAVQQSAAVTDLYKSVLGRTPDSGGMSYWTDKAAGGMPIDQIKTFMENSAEAQVNKLFQSVLGRSADAAGMAFYANTYDKSGGNLAEIEADLKASAEYKSAHPVPGFAGGGDFGGGLRLVGEKGPELEATGPSRIWNHQQLTSMMSGSSGSDAALVAEIRALRQEVAELRKVNAQTAKDTKRHADMFENATGNGGPLLVEIAK